MADYPHFENQTKRRREPDNPYYYNVKEKKGFKITQAQLVKAPGYTKPIAAGITWKQ